ncbi:hypothetical protein BMF94_3768 [Rhodotorula taiwanensis]|uniref:Zinc-ribbon 15 domain-containing protein n=1 Tax=Rhodotorula taiwanensis TaxID=741276 RepID=A0A2S5B9H1_9BASI|nr:hypothetical protein BMF94_3768 [Rhodotorula taiwanensis]
MCDFIPLCFTCGCDHQLSQEGHEAFICPRCHNGTVFPTKDRNCFTFCFVPLVPLGTKHLYRCTTCQWAASADGPPPPPAAQPGGFYGNQGPPGGAYGGGGYNPAYGQQQQMGYPTQPAQPGYH